VRLEEKARCSENPGPFSLGDGKDRPFVAVPEAHKNLRDDVDLRKPRSSFRYQVEIELVTNYQENDADDCPFQHAARRQRYLR
jgi:hypothetical protein